MFSTENKLGDLKFFARGEKFFVVHETLNPVAELTEEKLVPYIKVDGTFLYVLKTGKYICLMLETITIGSSTPTEYLQMKLSFSNVPFHAPGDLWAQALRENVQQVAKELLKFIQENVE